MYMTALLGWWLLDGTNLIREVNLVGFSTMHVLISAHVGFKMNWAGSSGIKWEGEILYNGFYNVKKSLVIISKLYSEQVVKMSVIDIKVNDGFYFGVIWKVGIPYNNRCASRGFNCLGGYKL